MARSLHFPTSETSIQAKRKVLPITSPVQSQPIQISDSLQVLDGDGDGKFRQIKGDKVLFNGEETSQSDPRVKAEMARLGLGKRKLWAQGNLHQLWGKSSHYRVVKKMIKEGQYSELMHIKIDLKRHGINLASNDQWQSWRKEAAQNKLNTLWENSECLSKEGNYNKVVENVRKLAETSIFLGIKFDSTRAENLMAAAKRNCAC